MGDVSSRAHPELGITRELIQGARDGSESALNKLFELSRSYLLRVADEGFPEDLKAKASASDLVQQSCLEAHQAFAQFQGGTEEEFKNWLQRILQYNQANFIRLFRDTGKREAGREEALPPPTADWPGPAASSASPSEKAIHQEEVEQLRQALERLPEDYRQVIQWHQQDRMNFEEIGQRLNRSAEAARKLWARGIEKLRDEIGGSHDAP